MEFVWDEERSVNEGGAYHHWYTTIPENLPRHQSPISILALDSSDHPGTDSRRNWGSFVASMGLLCDMVRHQKRSQKRLQATYSVHNPVSFGRQSLSLPRVPCVSDRLLAG